MEYVTDSKGSQGLSRISVVSTRSSFQIKDPNAISNQIINTTLFTNGANAGLLVTCWNQDFNFILDSCTNPNTWAGFYLACEESLPTLARLLENTVRANASDVRIFTIQDPADNSRKWVIGKFIGPPDVFQNEFQKGMQANPPRLPESYLEVIDTCKKFLMERDALAKKGQSVFSKIKIGIKSQSSPPGLPMPAAHIFGVALPVQSNRVDQSLGKATDALETMVGVGETMTGRVFESTASGVLGEAVLKTADHTAKPFDTQSEGHQKASRLLPIYIGLLVLFALLAIIASSAKPIGIFLLLIGVYNLIAQKAILQTGATLAYYEGNKAQIIGLIELGLGLVLIAFV